jgi:hypothetical protein
MKDNEQGAGRGRWGVTLAVHTARMSYRGDDRLDVTRKSAGPEGIAFAPSWAILRPALDALRCAEVLHAASGTAPAPGADAPRYAEGAAEMVRLAETVRTATWALYREAYTAEMRRSFRSRRHRPAWDALLARKQVTLCCYCVDPTHCHRTLLAGILATLGAVVVGERREGAA